MNLESMNTWWWLIPIITGAICGLLGYLIGKTSGRSNDGPANLKSLQEKNARLESDLVACRHMLSGYSQSEDGPISSFDRKAAKAAFGMTVKQDDLKIVEGIGPKIEGLFHNFDIKTWKSLSEATVSKCQEVLDSGGDRYKVHDPASWPLQAKLCYRNKWKELYKWQEEHKRGKL